MEERTTNNVVGMLLVVIVSNGAVSVGLHNLVTVLQSNQVATQIQDLMNDIESLQYQIANTQLSELYQPPSTPIVLPASLFSD